MINLNVKKQFLTFKTSGWLLKSHLLDLTHSLLGLAGKNSQVALVPVTIGSRCVFFFFLNETFIKGCNKLAIIRSTHLWCYFLLL